MLKSDAQRYIAENQLEILQRIYLSINPNNVDLNIPLSDIDGGHLFDFFLHSIGFLSIQNFENMLDSLSDDDIKAILAGKFKLKFLNNNEYKTLTENQLTKPKEKGNKIIEKLYTIQDGTYYIVTRKNAPSQDKKHQLILETDPIVYYSDNPNLKITNTDLLNIVRNLFAHDFPYIIDNHRYLLKYGEDEIVFSKMWLRGYSEIFSKSTGMLTAKHIQNILKSELPKQNNNLQNNSDIDKALSLLKDVFGEDVKKNFYKVNNFIKTRIKYIPDFFEIPLEDKINSLAFVLVNNQNYIRYGCESINPKIIYNIQQLISKELSTRQESSYFGDTSQLHSQLIELQKNLKIRDQEIKDYQASHKRLTTETKLILNNKINAYNELVLKFKTLKKVINNISTLETANMQLYDDTGLKHMPIELAANIVSQMGFTALVTSGFHEDLLVKTDYFELNDKQTKFFNSINLDKINFFVDGKEFKKPYSITNKMFILSKLRTAITHGFVTYTLPNPKSNQQATFKDVNLSFLLEDDNILINGKLDDFYNLFLNNAFIKPRDKEIITGEIVQLSPEQSQELQEEIMKQEQKRKILELLGSKQKI